MNQLSKKRTRIEGHEDHGFFGPDSVAWKVWGHPTSLTVGFQRAVVVEELDPALVASVNATQAIVQRPRTRYDRTIRYFAMVAFADSRSATEAADVLVKVHSKGIGIEPLTGKPYDANDPESQLWIHMTGWHSVLYAYEKYGPGKLSEAEERQFWQECAVAAELQTCSPDDVPRTREGVREYFEYMRPRLAGSEVAQRTMDHLLHADVMFPPLPAILKPGAWVVSRVLRAGTIATMPRWMRSLGGLRQPRLVDALITPLLRTTFFVVHLSPRLQLMLLGQISPRTVPVVAPILLGIPPRNPEIVSPAEARERLGVDKPAEAHLALRAKQASKVFGEGGTPSDEGIIESQAILGSIA
jgi:uncharacterized protein (DUF2236 family)